MVSPADNHAQGIPAMKLTAKAVNALTLLPGKGDVIFFDDAMPGFGYRLRLGAGGKVLRSWVVQYRRASATRRMLLGSAEVVGAEQARLQAKKALGAVANGQDPQGERADRRDADKLTLRKAIDEFLAVKKRELRPRSYTETARYLTSAAYFGPLHNLPLDTITRRDIAPCIVRIARESGNPAATQARAKLSGLYSWSMTMGMAEANPVVGTHEPAGNKPRERVLSNAEIAAIWRAAGDDEFGKIVKLLTLTGCRRAEIGGMCWSEISADGTSWTLPAARSKNHRAHTLPLMPMMREIVENVPRMVSRDQLFGERADRGFVAWHTNKHDELDRRLGDQVQPWNLHDIRRTVATRMCDIGIAPHVVEQIINHLSGHRAGVAGTYNRSPYEREVRNALAMWERYIALVTDRELYAAHQKYLADGGEKAANAFHDAIAAGGGHWEDYLRSIVEGGERKVLGFHTPPAAI
jgi:integrase